MKMKYTKQLPVIVGLTFIIGLFSFAVADTPAAIKPKEKLSDYGFFTGNIKDLSPANQVFPYTLNSTLFSNYAEKLRFVYIPHGAKVNYTDTGVLQFPEGSILIKNFYYSNDERHPEKGRRIIETRLLAHTSNGWEAWPYYWNNEQTEAYYDVAGETTEISYINENGKKIKAPYYVPNKNECKGCHSFNQQMIPIGPTAAQLNRTADNSGTQQNQLLNWQSLGWLQGLPALEKIPKMPVWNDATSGTINQRARAYLDANCAHCHRTGGPAETSGLLLTYSENNSTSSGVNKAPVATGKGSAGRLFDIVPGKPEASILLYRMQTTDPGQAMPELGREQVHKEAITLITEWIKSMTPNGN